jgi:DNA-binding winged helix-turn-helix (wHTH) protein
MTLTILLRVSAYVSLASPETKATHHFLDAKAIACLPHGAIGCKPPVIETPADRVCLSFLISSTNKPGRFSILAYEEPAVNNVAINAPAERMTQPFSDSAKAASSDLVQNVTPQLRAYFRAQGCVLPIAEELAQKVTGELSARVQEVLRRPGLGPLWISGVMQAGDLKLDLQSHVLWLRDDEIHLSPKEFDLLAFMMKNADVLLTHTKLLQSVWGLEYGGELEYLRTYICSLRKKIEANPANPEYIVNEPWIGYRFRIREDSKLPSFRPAQPVSFNSHSPTMR